METVVAIAIVVLAVIFLGALIALIVLCRHRYCRKVHFNSLQEEPIQRASVTLVRAGPNGSVRGSGRSQNGDTGSASVGVIYNSDLQIELGQVQFDNLGFDEMLSDESWLDDDNTGLMHHCIEILKTCKLLTEKLVAMTMGKKPTFHTTSLLNEIISVAKRINPRVDDVVKSMYPPLDPKLLEARCNALFLSVYHLMLVTKNACQAPETLGWIDGHITSMEQHLQVLREASLRAEETDSRNSSISSGPDTYQPIITPHQQELSHV